MPLLEIKNLSVVSNNRKIVSSISLTVPERSIVSIVGGSGSGKTTIGLSILRLLPKGLKMTDGLMSFSGSSGRIDLNGCNERQIQSIRGKQIAMIFQEPLYAFNPLFRIGEQIEEALRFHTDKTSLQRKQRILEVLSLAGLPDPERAARSFPHELSGGMRQRAMIAQAIACDPQLLIADEPTSNLDVTLQAKIIELFRSLREKLNLSILLITHDLGVVSHLADEVVVLKKGEVVEKGKTVRIMSRPSHEYTKELLASS